VRWVSAVALVVAGCSGSEPLASPSSPADLSSRAKSTGERGEIELWGELAGCVVEVRPEVPRSIFSICYVDGGGTGGPAIRGQLLYVDGRNLMLGERRYGPIRQASRVVIDADGVHADGVHLGPLP
jgi:hypothetical protein